MESKVWKDMLEIGNDGNMKDQGTITLAEDSATLFKFFKILNPRDLLDEDDVPQEIRNLNADSVVSLMELAEKFNTPLVHTFIYLQLRQKMIPVFLDTEQWKGFRIGDGWDDLKILKFFVMADNSQHLKLLNVAAKMSFLIKDLLGAQSRQTVEFVDLKRHLAPLHHFRLRWEGVKAKLLDTTLIDDFSHEQQKSFRKKLEAMPLNFVRGLGNSFGKYNLALKGSSSHTICASRLTSAGVQALYFDQALLDLEYRGMDELD